MQLVIHAGSDMPIYRQIADQIVDAIVDGHLLEGDRLASHRELAEQLVIAPLTVKKAYDSLEAEGLVLSVRGRGTFVSVAASGLAAESWQDRLRAPARRLLAQADIAGVPFTRLVAWLRSERSALTSQGVTRATKKSSRSKEAS